MHRSIRSTTTRRLVAAIGVLAVAAATLVAGPPSVSAQQAPSPTGLTQQTAAASCWEIRQAYPSSPTGIYWLVTPALGAPERFHCDMTTDGGGWVLIGRGREGWRTNYDGFGTTAQVREIVNGTQAFTPRQLSSQVIDGLLNNNRVDALTDPIRVRRATNTAGTQWQEARFRFANGTRDRWVWTFPAEHRVGQWSFGTGSSDSGSGGQTNSFGNNSQFRRIITTATSAQGWTHGWSFGSQVTGTTSATSYLWSSVNNRGEARPFTQVYLRPRLRLADLTFPTVPDQGLPAEELTPLLQNGVIPGAWGVTGLANGRDTELTAEVSAFAQIGDRVYVGGNFSHVQRGAGATGADRVAQPYLAAFDVHTGDWISGFRPTFNEQVKSLQGLPDGTLMVGGEFTQANGQAAVGLVRLNGTTGATASGWQPALENRTGAGNVNVRAMDVGGDWLYVGGLFTHVARAGSNPVFARMATRISLTTGQPDPNWNPAFDGSIIDLDVSSQGDRVYASGYFNNSATGQTRSVAAISTAAGAATAVWNPTWSSPAPRDYQQAIMEVGSRIWVGGSEHSMFSYNRTSFQRLSGNITKQGGDFQTVGTANGIVYGSCHCNEWNYSNAFTWSNVGTNWTQADRIGFIGAWDAATGAVVPDFNPILVARAGRGPWATHTDSLGNVWFGGDLTQATRTNGTGLWVGGFVRFAHRDTTAPTTPTGLLVHAGTAPGTIDVSWGASTDDTDGTGVTYEVLIGNRVVHTTDATTAVLASGDPNVRVAVRAIDTAGNRSATTPVATVTDPSDAPTVELVAAGSSWRWRFVNGAWPAGWTTTGFDDASWATGAAPLGFGSASIATNIDVPPPTSNRPLSAWFRHTFEVSDVGSLSTATITTHADDGLVVWVNGVEVGRAEMPTGTLTSASYPLSAPRTNAAMANPVTFVVPASLLVDGTNVVAASTHLSWRATPDVSFDLTMTGLRGSGDADPPAPPVVSATLDGTDAAVVSWTHPDPGDVLGYEVSRDGTQIALVTGGAMSHRDEGLAAETTYGYAVVAIDASGNRSTPGTASVTTPTPPTEPTVELVTAGSSWRWQFVNGAWPAGWTTTGFDDASWATGAAPLGFGSASIATNIDVPPPTSNRPLSAWFRHTFQVQDASELVTATITTRADDGVVVWVNGVEVGRAEMPTGTLTSSSYPLTAQRTNVAVANPATFVIPGSLLVNGTNVVAASTHLSWRATPDVSFDLTMTGLRGSGDADPPAPPVVSATLDGADAAVVSWTHPEPADVLGYEVSRDGTQIALVTGGAMSHRDEGLAAATTHTYSVVAIDASGNRSTPGTASVTTPAAPQQPVQLVAAGSTWRWQFVNGAWPAGWTTTGFDDASWASGAAPLGFGSASIATNIDVPPPTSNRPLSAWFRHTFQVADVGSLSTATITTRADDGIVVWVNGVEVGRAEMPAGLTSSSYPLTAQRTNVAVANPVTFVIPSSALVNGTNVVAASTHLSWRATPDVSFELTMVGNPAG